MQKSIAIACVAFLLSCSGWGHVNQVSGTLSETDTGCALEGYVVYANGISASKAKVLLHDMQSVSVITLAKKKALTRSGITQTNINGFFSFDSVDTGKYIVEVNDHDTSGALLSVQIKHKDTLVTVNALLRIFGCIIGKIDTSKDFITPNTVIYLPELNRIIKIDSSGTFIIPSLPEWNYQLRIAIRDSLIRLPSDTITIPVKPGDTTRVISFGSKTGSIVITGKVEENPPTN